MGKLPSGENLEFFLCMRRRRNIDHVHIIDNYQNEYKIPTEYEGQLSDVFGKLMTSSSVAEAIQVLRENEIDN